MWGPLIGGLATLLVAFVGAGAFKSRPERLRRQLQAEIELIEQMEKLGEDAILRDRIAYTARRYAVASSAAYRNFRVAAFTLLLTVGTMGIFVTGNSVLLETKPNSPFVSDLTVLQRVFMSALLIVPTWQVLLAVREVEKVRSRIKADHPLPHD